MTLPAALGVGNRYSLDAEAYEKGWAPVLLPRGCELLERLPLDTSGLVLDAGAGVGTLLLEIKRRAPSANVIAMDCSAGMLARAPGTFPRVVMDLTHLGFARSRFDVVVMAFMLFHLENPLQGLQEAACVLRPGGTAGTATWESEPRFPAQSVLNEELDSAGALSDTTFFANHEPLSSEIRMQSLLADAGYEDIRTWTTSLDHQYEMEEFILVRTTRGASRRRFESIDEEGRALFLSRLRRRLAGMTRSDFVDRTRIIYAAARRTEGDPARTVLRRLVWE